MNLVQADSMAPMLAADESLIQRVASHVLLSQAAGRLPRLEWHLNLSATERQKLRTRWPQPCAFWGQLEQREAVIDAPVDHADLLMPLLALLMAHRAGADDALTVLSNMLACACFGSHHLWQDLGATGRDEVSQLLKIGFPALFASNTRNLRWKRHLFLVLGEQLGRQDLRPPKCDHCDNYEACFGAAFQPATKTWPLKPGR